MMEVMAIMMVTFSVAFAIIMVVIHLFNSCSTNIVYNEVYLMNRVLLAKCSCLMMMMMTLTLKAAFLGIPMIPICRHHIGALSQNLALKESGPDACSLNCVSLKRLIEKPFGCSLKSVKQLLIRVEAEGHCAKLFIWASN